MKVREVAKIDTEMLRQFCITYKFYTKGDNSEYCNMFGMARQYDGSADALSMIALDIVFHSEPKTIAEYTESFSIADSIIPMMNLIDKHCIIRHYEEVCE